MLCYIDRLFVLLLPANENEVEFIIFFYTIFYSLCTSTYTYIHSYIIFTRFGWRWNGWWDIYYWMMKYSKLEDEEVVWDYRIRVGYTYSMVGGIWSEIGNVRRKMKYYLDWICYEKWIFCYCLSLFACLSDLKLCIIESVHGIIIQKSMTKVFRL